MQTGKVHASVAPVSFVLLFLVSYTPWGQGLCLLHFTLMVRINGKNSKGTTPTKCLGTVSL